MLLLKPLIAMPVHVCSSIMESMNGSVSNGFGDRLWPFDMGGGIPINCTSDDRYTQICSEEERWPGLWEVPGAPSVDGGTFATGCSSHDR
jgi:hypothetical protein